MTSHSVRWQRLGRAVEPVAAAAVVDVGHLPASGPDGLGDPASGPELRTRLGAAGWGHRGLGRRKLAGARRSSRCWWFLT